MAVGGSERRVEVAFFVFEALRQRCLERPQRGILGQRHGQRRIPRDALRHGHGVGECLTVGDDVGNDARVGCLLRGDEIAGQQHRHGFGLADGSDEPLGAAAPGDHPEFDLGHTELRRLAGDDDVARECEFTATAERQTLHGRDDGLGVGAQVGPDGAAQGRPVPE